MKFSSDTFQMILRFFFHFWRKMGIIILKKMVGQIFFPQNETYQKNKIRANTFFHLIIFKTMFGFFPIKDTQTSPHPPSPFGNGQIFMKDAECAE